MIETELTTKASPEKQSIPKGASNIKASYLSELNVFFQRGPSVQNRIPGPLDIARSITKFSGIFFWCISFLKRGKTYH